MVPPDTVFQAGNPSEVNDGDQAAVIESLGEALAGVNIGATISNPHTSQLLGSSSLTTTPFSIAPGPGTQVLRESAVSNDGWGNFVAPPSEEAVPTLETGSHVRNESIDFFLSKSPSQTLGDDVFKFSHTNLPALNEESQEPPSELPDDAFRMRTNSTLQTTSSNYGEIHRHHEQGRRRMESPSASVTGTTTSSRSVSPYGHSSEAASSRLIPSYQNRFEAPPPNDGVANAFYSPGEAARRSPYVKDKNPYRNSLLPAASNGYDASRFDLRPPSSNEFGIPTEQSQHQLLSNGTSTTNGQVLYMAMPSPDGRGQVLQPVQMMQLPGKPFTYVVPGSVTGMHGGMQQQMISDQQGMMVLPAVQNGRSSFSSDGRNVSGGSNYAIPGNDAFLFGDMSSNEYSTNDFDQSQLSVDPDLASLYASTQRPPLESLLGQIRRLSRDQVGCRLVQQALDEEGPMAATLILQEGLPFWGEAMVDPFGNYLFQKVLEKVTPEERIMLVKNVSSRLVNASLNLHGTRSVQKVVELCAQDGDEGRNGVLQESAASVLTAALAPAAARLCIDSHGNHVIQRILLRLGTNHSQFVFDAVAASVGDVARHRHGCCVIQRCLDSPQSEARAYLVRCIVERSLDLMQDAYGNYVIQYVLDVCCDEDVQAVCESVVGRVNLLAIQKFSSNVMEKCLERCSDQVKEAYLLEMSDPDRVRELMMDPFGNYVIQRAISVATHAQAVRLVEAMRPHLLAAPSTGPNGARNGGVRNTAGGRRIIAKVCRRFPNFTLNPVGTQEELYSQNKGNHRYLNHHQQSGIGPSPQLAPHPSAVAAYAPIGVPVQHYAADPRIGQMPVHPNQQAQGHITQYGSGSSSVAYYDAFFGSGGGYQGM
jgi:Pumilio-family RNA binding repeat